MNIKIFVAYHSNAEIVENEVYKPIQVGRSRSSEILPMIGDNIGFNISEKNNIYCELTALYWIWKNCENADYIGLCHYRRFFTFEKFPLTEFKKWCLYLYSKFFLSSIFSGVNFVKDSSHLVNNFELLNRFNEDFTVKLKIKIGKYDIVTLKPTRLSGMDIKTLFSQPSGLYHFKVLESLISDKYPHFLEFFKFQCKSNKLYPANMCIFKRDIFNEYASFLFDILESHEQFCIEDKWCYDPLNEKSFHRLSGYLSEVLTSTFVNYYKSNKSIKIKYLNQIFYSSIK